jgi:hypothetical protein
VEEYADNEKNEEEKGILFDALKATGQTLGWGVNSYAEMKARPGLRICRMQAAVSETITRKKAQAHFLDITAL